MFLDDLSEFLRPRLAPHLQRLWRPDIGSQILFANGGRRRIPTAGKTAPYYHDTAYHPRLTAESVLAVGVNGWNWCDGRSEYVTFDLDGLNHGEGLPAEQLAEIVRRLMVVPEVELIRSKSAHGYHARVYFDPQPHAFTHNHHARNAARALAWLAEKTGLPLAAEVDMVGAIAWIYHANTAPSGFDLLKEAR